MPVRQVRPLGHFAHEQGESGIGGEVAQDQLPAHRQVAEMRRCRCAVDHEAQIDDERGEDHHQRRCAGDQKRQRGDLRSAGENHQGHRHRLPE